MITITEKAQKRLLELKQEENLTESHFLRVGVEGGGCSGLSYKFGFDLNLQEGDTSFEDRGISIVCDRKSLLYLLGTELDYSDGLNGKGFEFHNPNAARVCSCGDSFAV